MKLGVNYKIWFNLRDWNGKWDDHNVTLELIVFSLRCMYSYSFLILFFFLPTITCFRKTWAGVKLMLLVARQSIFLSMCQLLFRVAPLHLELFSLSLNLNCWKCIFDRTQWVIWSMYLTPSRQIRLGCGCC